MTRTVYMFHLCLLVHMWVHTFDSFPDACFSYAPWTRLHNLLFTPFTPQAPPTPWVWALIGWARAPCRHRSQRPFIWALGRWTPHLLNNGGAFSIFTAADLGFYYFSSPATFALLSEVWLDFPWAFSLWTFSVFFFGTKKQQTKKSPHTKRDKDRRAGGCSGKASHLHKEACGSLFAFFFFLLLFFFPPGSVGILCWTEKAWERSCPRQLERLKLLRRSPERLQLHPPRATDR